MSDLPSFGIPYEALGGEPVVRAIARDFYAVMARDEPALARLHACDAAGQVLPENQERFALFLIGWLGGPQTYIEQHGHPRLRMRHGRVKVDVAMRDAWLRCMTRAFDQHQVTGEVRAFLDAKLADLADFLRNTPG
jgi:hemoglobin